MVWIKIDDRFDEHPKMAQVGPVGWGIWLAGLAYSNRNLTDGFIPLPVARTLGSFTTVDASGQVWTLGRTSGHQGEDLTIETVIETLVSAGLWREARGGYAIHDYGDFQPLKTEILRLRKRGAERVKRHRNAVTPPVTNTVGSSGPVTRNPLKSKSTSKTFLSADADSSPSGEGRNPAVLELTSLLAELMRSNDPKARPAPDSDTWARDMRLLVKDRDGDVDEVRRIIQWSQADAFWQSNILSPGKLRKQFSQLVMKAAKPPASSAAPPPKENASSMLRAMGFRKEDYIDGTAVDD